MNTHESYVSLETAKLLKQAGFDWEIKTFYFNNELGETILGEAKNHNFREQFISAPTLAVAQRWLREVKDTIIDVNSSYLPKGYGVSYCVHWKEPNKMMQAIEKSETSSFYKMFLTYEEALEAGIKKVLEILLKKGK